MRVATNGRQAVARARPQAKVRVMIVDDSAVIRGVLARWLAHESDIDVVGEASTGREAIERVAALRPDVILLDVEMPDIDGVAALPELLRRGHRPVVIMMSSATQHQASATLRSLQAGAVDYVAKPQSRALLSGAALFREGLVERVRLLGTRTSARRPLAAIASPMPPSQRKPTGHRPRAVVVGASTGGPQALAELMPSLAPVIDRVPILIVQHMPAAFSQRMADHLAAYCGRPVRVAASGDRVRAGEVYLAPGDRHMEIAAGDRGEMIVLNDAPPENFCRPAADRLFRSAAEVWRAGVIGLVLTGMGQDGAKGARRIAHRGGVVFAQDEASSVVWGMPGAAVEQGGCLAVLTLAEMAEVLTANIVGAPA